MNGEGIAQQLDFIHFAYGCFLGALFLICVFLHVSERERPERLPWALLGLFGAIYCVHEWLELASTYRPPDSRISSLNLPLMALAYLSLMEFGRRGTPRLAGARAAWGLYGTALLLVLSGLPYGLDGVSSASRTFLALPAGLLAAGAFYRQSWRRPAAERRSLLALSVAFTLLAAVTGIFVPASGFPTARLLNGDSFLTATGLPIYLPRALLGLLITSLLGWYSLLPAQLGRKSHFAAALAVAVLTLLGGGWYLTEHQGRRAALELEKDTRADIANLVTHIDDTLRNADMTARNLAESPPLAAALAAGAAADLDQANLLLDQHQRTMGQAICYLMDAAGRTIASSNRDAADSFVGKSYAFRPYFTEAIAGRPGTYFALGVTSGERGYYTGWPVRDTAGRILGVAVVKSRVDALAKTFAKHERQFLVGPEGVIFMAGSRDYLFRTLWPLSPERRAPLLASRQFGEVSFEPLLEREPPPAVYLKEGEATTYLLRSPIGVAGWSVVLLHDTSAIALARMLGIGVTFVLGVAILAGFLVLLSSESALQGSLQLLELRRRSEEALNEKLLLQQFVAEVNRALQGSDDLRAALQQETEIIVRHLGAAFARIWTLNPATSQLELQASGGLYTQVDGAHARIPIGQDKVGQIAGGGRPVFSNAVVGDPGFTDQEWARREGMQAFAGYPLRVEGRVIGVLGLFARRPLNESVLESLGLASNIIAAAIERRRAENALREKTHQLEDLTRHLEQRVAAEVAVRTRNEQLLVQQSKMAAMGEMLGAIAHQWRQPLNTLGMCVQNIGDVCAQGELDRPYIEKTVCKSMDQIQHMSATIDDFRNFFLTDKERSRFDVMVAVGDVLALLSAQLTANDIAFRLTCHTHARSFEQLGDLEVCPEKTIDGFRNEFGHVILNLVINARDAIATRREAAPDEAAGRGLITFDFFNRYGEVVIEVGDNGAGIPEAIMPRIFEPYFTSKDAAKGTGIGLYMSKIIVEEHMKGSLGARNGPAGAVFSISLRQAERVVVS